MEAESKHWRKMPLEVKKKERLFGFKANELAILNLRQKPTHVSLSNTLIEDNEDDELDEILEEIDDHEDSEL